MSWNVQRQVWGSIDGLGAAYAAQKFCDCAMTKRRQSWQDCPSWESQSTSNYLVPPLQWIAHTQRSRGALFFCSCLKVFTRELTYGERRNERRAALKWSRNPAEKLRIHERLSHVALLIHSVKKSPSRYLFFSFFLTRMTRATPNKGFHLSFSGFYFIFAKGLFWCVHFTFIKKYLTLGITGGYSVTGLSPFWKGVCQMCKILKVILRIHWIPVCLSSIQPLFKVKAIF